MDEPTYKLFPFIITIDDGYNLMRYEVKLHEDASPNDIVRTLWKQYPGAEIPIEGTKLSHFSSTSKEKINDLKKCELMLARIAHLVQEFQEENENTLQGVARLLALYRDQQAVDAWNFLEEIGNK